MRRRTVRPCRSRRKREGDSGVPQHEFIPTANHTPLRTPVVHDAPIVPLAVLLETDASPREIARRLRLNLAIRMLLDAIAEQGVAS
jgi:hypothetical protein